MTTELPEMYETPSSNAYSAVCARADVTGSPMWRALIDHQRTLETAHLRELFAEDPGRGQEMTVAAADLYVDYSKHLVTRDTLTLLLDLARAAGVEERRDAMLAGEHVNTSEDRAVLHTALRMPPESELEVDGQNVTADVHAMLDRMGEFTDRVRSGDWRGATGEPIRTVVNIGIGGSDLGPADGVPGIATLRRWPRGEVRLERRSRRPHVDSLGS